METPLNKLVDAAKGIIDPLKKAEAALELADKSVVVIDKAATVVTKQYMGIIMIVLLVVVGLLGYLVYRQSIIVTAVTDTRTRELIQELAEEKATRIAAQNKNIYKDSIQGVSNVTIGEQNQIIKALKEKLESK